jgi:hypothetical protein
MYTSAMAGPECQTYHLNFGGNSYVLNFSCKTAGIGGVEVRYNTTEFVQTYMYFWDGDTSILIPKVASFYFYYDILFLLYEENGAWYWSGIAFLPAKNS